MLFQKNLYRCAICGRLESPALCNNRKPNKGWIKIKSKWYCDYCYDHFPYTEAQLETRREANRHHNLAVQGQLLKGKHKKKYKKILAYA